VSESCRHFVEVWTPLIASPQMLPELREQRYREWVQALVELKWVQPGEMSSCSNVK
jgi:hypothetical protein